MDRGYCRRPFIPARECSAGDHHLTWHRMQTCTWLQLQSSQLGVRCRLWLQAHYREVAGLQQVVHWRERR